MVMTEDYTEGSIAPILGSVTGDGEIMTKMAMLIVLVVMVMHTLIRIDTTSTVAKNDTFTVIVTTTNARTSRGMGHRCQI
jgi:hypothetical protein